MPKECAPNHARATVLDAADDLLLYKGMLAVRRGRCVKEEHFAEIPDG